MLENSAKYLLYGCVYTFFFEREKEIILVYSLKCVIVSKDLEHGLCGVMWAEGNLCLHLRRKGNRKVWICNDLIYVGIVAMLLHFFTDWPYQVQICIGKNIYVIFNEGDGWEVRNSSNTWQHLTSGKQYTVRIVEK